MPDNFSSSPADGTHVFDDFHSNTSIATGLLGNLDWDRTVIVAGGSTPTYIASPNGILRIVTDGNATRGEALHLAADAVTLGGGDGVVFRARLRMVTTVTGNLFRIGWDDSVTATDGTVGIFITSTSGVLAFDVASTNGDVSKAVTGISTLTSGTTMVAGTWYDLELRLSDTNTNGGPETIQCFVDGEFGGEISAAAGDPSLLGSTETMEYKIAHWDTAGTAQVLEIDYYESYIPRV